MLETNTSLILNGIEVSNKICKNIKNEISILKSNNKRVPGLAVVLVGNNIASKTYVKNKEKKCTELGIYSEIHNLNDDISEETLISLIHDLNLNNKIDGIIVQLPLPKHINANKIILEINPLKDVDGLHPVNLGKLLSGQECLISCTPHGVIKILKHYSIDISSKNAVIIGRSTLVGKPLSLLLLNENASVTVVHSKTKNITEYTKQADILIAAAGSQRLVKKDWIKKDAVIVDVGINKIESGEKNILVGDVDFNDVVNSCRAITPVPGGVGPVTVAMLMSNTLLAYKLQK